MNIKDLNTFGKRVEFLLDLKEIQKKELANALNLSPTAITNYIKDKREPNIATIIAIADYLNVDVNFLLCQSDNYETRIIKEHNNSAIEITFNDDKLHFTKEEIEDLLAALDSYGWDVNKLLKK